MKILIDTHILLYLLFDDSQLSKKEISLLQNEKNDIIVSSISLFEISLKYSLEKLKLTNITPEDIPDILIQNGYFIENIDYQTFATFYKLPNELHKDPFDRLLISESIQKNFIVLTHDKEFKYYEKYGLKLVSTID